MTKLIFLLLSLIIIVFGDHSDHADASHAVSIDTVSDQQSTDKRNVHTRNGEKHEAAVMALIDEMDEVRVRGDDWIVEEVVDEELGQEDDAETEDLDDAQEVVYDEDKVDDMDKVDEVTPDDEEEDDAAELQDDHEESNEGDDMLEREGDRYNPEMVPTMDPTTMPTTMMPTMDPTTMYPTTYPTPDFKYGDDVEEESNEEDDVLEGEGDIVDERVIEDDIIQEIMGNLDAYGVTEDDISLFLETVDEEQELVAVQGSMERVNGGHWMSMVLLLAMAAVMAVLLIHLLRKCNAKKVTTIDTEHTPLIANKV